MCGIVLCQVLWWLVGLWEIVIKVVEIVNFIWEDVGLWIEVMIVLFVVIVIKY